MAETVLGQSARAATASVPRTAQRIALALWLAVVGMVLVELWMIAVTLDRPTPVQWGFRGFEAILTLSFGSVGALVAARRPENRIGWVLLLLLGIVGGVQAVLDQYPVLADAADPPGPFGDAARWVAAWIWVIPALAIVAFVPLIFPDGRLISGRWRAAVLFASVAMLIQVGSIIIAMRPLGTLPPTVNVARYFEYFGPIFLLSYLPFLAAAGVAAASLVVRYRRARGDERQQIKWVAYAQIVVAVGAIGGTSPLVLGQLFFIGTIFFAAAAFAIAILRYRLYEIDLIINRTLVYGTLTALLAGVYTASIALSQRVFVAATGEESDAAIVLTTLIVVSLFTPLKTRLQTLVDTRFKPAPSPGTVPAATPVATTDDSGRTPTHAEAVELLARLAELHRAGALTGGEFRAKKADLLRRI